MTKEKFNLPEIATVDRIELEFNDLVSKTSSMDLIEWNFKNVRFIEPSTSLTLIIALIFSSYKKGIGFKIIPPKNNGIKIILYTWRFFEVLEEITMVPLNEFAPDIKNEIDDGKEHTICSILEKKVKYLKNIETSEFINFFNSYYRNQGSIQFLTLNERFFPLVTLNFESFESSKKELNEEKRRWENGNLVRQVLNNNLSGIKLTDEIPNDVVGETISNSIIHSEANKFFTGSFFNSSDSNNAHFTINFWDNGKSIINTLKVPLENKQSIRSERSLKDYERVTKNFSQLEFLIKKGKHDFSESLFASNVELTPELADEQILLAAFFPGVSSAHTRVVDLNFEATISTGNGLSLLLNTVVNRLKGEISVRTKNHFLNLKQLNNYDKDQYIDMFKVKDGKKPKRKEVFDENNTYFSAKFNVFEKNVPSFIGNMITIRIPIKYN